MEFITRPIGFGTQIALADPGEGESCSLHRPSQRNFGPVMRRFWKMQDSESTESFDFPEFGATALVKVKALLKRWRTKAIWGNAR